MELGLEGNDYLIDAAAGASVNLGAYRIEGGYRYFGIDNSDHSGVTREELNVKLAGPYLAVEFRF